MNAEKFTAVDEIGIDWTGSDEPYFVFYSIGEDGAQHRSQSRVFGDIDTGDTVRFDGTEGCLYRLRVICSGDAAPNGIGFSILVLEDDFGASDLTGHDRTGRRYPRASPGSRFHFVRHLVEMFLAMMAGMMLDAGLLAAAVGTSVPEARRDHAVALGAHDGA